MVHPARAGGVRPDPDLARSDDRDRRKALLDVEQWAQIGRVKHVEVLRSEVGPVSGVTGASVRVQAGVSILNAGYANDPKLASSSLRRQLDSPSENRLGVRKKRGKHEAERDHQAAFVDFGRALSPLLVPVGTIPACSRHHLRAKQLRPT